MWLEVLSKGKNRGTSNGKGTDESLLGQLWLLPCGRSGAAGGLLSDEISHVLDQWFSFRPWDSITFLQILEDSTEPLSMRFIAVDIHQIRS